MAIVGFEYVGLITCLGARQDNSIGIETTTKAAHSRNISFSICVARQYTSFARANTKARVSRAIRGYSLPISIAARMRALTTLGSMFFAGRSSIFSLILNGWDIKPLSLFWGVRTIWAFVYGVFGVDSLNDH
jgi:hypothetical protein